MKRLMSALLSSVLIGLALPVAMAVLTPGGASAAPAAETALSHARAESPRPAVRTRPHKTEHRERHHTKRHHKTRVRVVHFKGRVGAPVRPGHLGPLRKTSKSFRTFAKHELKRIWGWTNDAPECESDPTLFITLWRSDGWATIADEGLFKKGMLESCARGGNYLYVHRVKGKWHAALGGQAQPACFDYHIGKYPVDVVNANDPTCYSDTGDLIKYADSPWNPKSFFTPAHAAQSLAANSTGPMLWADETAQDDVYANVYQPDATMTFLRCFGANDPQYGHYVAPDKVSCVFTETWSDGSTSHFVLHMHQFPTGRWEAYGHYVSVDEGD